MFDLNTGDAPSESNFGPVLDGKATLLEQQPPQHQPRHDVESVFWVLVCCVVRAPPDGADDMLYHEIPLSEQYARRSSAMDRKRVEGGTSPEASRACKDDRPNVRVALHQLACSVNTIQPLHAPSRIQTSSFHADPRNRGGGD